MFLQLGAYNVSVVWTRSTANSMYDYGIPFASAAAASGFRQLASPTDDIFGSSSSSSSSSSSTNGGGGGGGFSEFFPAPSSSTMSTTSDDFSYFSSPARIWTGAMGHMQRNGSDALVGLFQVWQLTTQFKPSTVHSHCTHVTHFAGDG